jgi:hypothetical protein
MDNTPFQPITVFLKSNDYSNLLGTSNYFFELNQPILVNSNVDVLVSLSSFKFTNSFYTVNAFNNILYFITPNSGFDIYNVKLTLGNYDIYSLVGEINKQFANKFYSIVVTYNSSNFTTTFTHTLGTSFYLYAGTNNCLKLFGFDSKLGSDAINYSATATSPNCINLIPSQILHIAVPNLSIKSFSSKNTKRYSIIDTVHITASKGETNLYINSSPFRFKINDGHITFLNILILDENYNSVNFNGVDWYIKLCFEFTYRNNLIIPDRLIEQYKYMQPVIEDEEKRNYNKLLDSIINYRKKISK